MRVAAGVIAKKWLRAQFGTEIQGWLAQLGVEDPILDVAKGLEKEALEDQYFVERKLYPNVDFYSGIIYRALGIPIEMFTVMFALPSAASASLPLNSLLRKETRTRWLSVPPDTMR